MTPQIIEGRAGIQAGEVCYDTPAPDFALSRITLSQGQHYAQTTRSIEILLCLSGETVLHAHSQTIHIGRGECAVVFAGKSYDLQAITAQAVVFRAHMPRA
jgi:mannose-6-phosphate isomerase